MTEDLTSLGMGRELTFLKDYFLWSQNQWQKLRIRMPEGVVLPFVGKRNETVRRFAAWAKVP